jgi:serine/threonine-protein kinase RsbW
MLQEGTPGKEEVVVVGRPPDRRGAPAVRPLLLTIVPGHLPAIRTQVEALASDYGLPPEQVSDWVTAVNELVANVVRHGGGEGELRAWVAGALFCEVRDNGPGFAAGAYLEPSNRPVPSGEGGMGLWIVRQMTDAMEIDSGPYGTVVRISTRRHGDA